MRKLPTLLLVAGWLAGGAYAAAPTPVPATASLPDIRIVMHTNKGDIKLLLFPSKAPLSVANFLNLAQKKFYDNLRFHRVIHEFMIQGGDPDGNGSGGPGYEFKDEITGLKFDKPGVLAMANRGQNTNGSQFFITHVPTPHLNVGFNIFGQVTEGQPVVNDIEQNDVIQGIEILDPTDALFKAEAAQIEEWNTALAARNVKAVPTPTPRPAAGKTSPAPSPAAP